MNCEAPNIFIVDDDASVLRSLARLVRAAGYEPKAYASAEDFLENHAQPVRWACCLVLDLSMPGLGGLDLQRRLSSLSSSMPVIFISGNGDIQSTVRAMKQGAVTFLAKPFDDDDLLVAVAEALEQHRRSLARECHVRSIELRLGQLTERERQVMECVITGALNKQIAAGLGIAEKTVKVHRGRVMEKMEVVSVAELVILCAAAGIVPMTGWAADGWTKGQ